MLIQRGQGIVELDVTNVQFVFDVTKKYYDKYGVLVDKLMVPSVVFFATTYMYMPARRLQSTRAQLQQQNNSFQRRKRRRTTQQLVASHVFIVCLPFAHHHHHHHQLLLWWWQETRNSMFADVNGKIRESSGYFEHVDNLIDLEF